MSSMFNDWYFSTGQHYRETEEWWLIPGWDEYAICRRGIVMRNGRYLKPHKGDKQGHLNIRLSMNGKKKEEYLHRLVAKTFIPNKQNKSYVCHKDDDKENNDVENLYWGDQKDNHKDCVRNGKYYSVTNEDREKGLSKVRKPVIATNIRTGEKKEYISQTEATKVLNLQQSNVGKVLYKERKHTGGYIFEFKEVV